MADPADDSRISKLREDGSSRRFPWRRPAGSPSIFSTAGSFSAPLGAHIRTGEVGGYYIDFRDKARSSSWPPSWLVPGGRQLYVAPAQWGLGCYEHYLAGRGGEWLAAAGAAAEYLVGAQQPDGGWIHRFPYHHTYPLAPPWMSAMAQGEGASLLVRLHLETHEERFRESALLALGPMRRPVGSGGVAAQLDGGPFPEEYPTDPPSFVLNGAIFALWGAYDAGLGLSDPGAEALFRSGAETLARALPRYDTGYWSRYDLYPHPVRNVASGAYHQLHIEQLRALALTAPPEARDTFAAFADRFQRYTASRSKPMRAMAEKIAFRVAVPRNRALARWLPWNRF